MAKKKKKATAKLREKRMHTYGVVYFDRISPAIPVEGRKPVSYTHLTLPTILRV